jgi:hypothetical protein
LGFLLGSVVLFYERILTEAGRFLTPEGRGDTEGVIVEGTELRKGKAVEAPIRGWRGHPILFLSREKVRKTQTL